MYNVRTRDFDSASTAVGQGQLQSRHGSTLNITTFMPQPEVLSCISKVTAQLHSKQKRPCVFSSHSESLSQPLQVFSVKCEKKHSQLSVVSTAQSSHCGGLLLVQSMDSNMTAQLYKLEPENKLDSYSYLTGILRSLCHSLLATKRTCYCYNSHVKLLLTNLTWQYPLTLIDA